MNTISFQLVPSRRRWAVLRQQHSFIWKSFPDSSDLSRRRGAVLRQQHSPASQLQHWARHLSRSLRRLGTDISIQELLDIREQAQSDATIGYSPILLIDRSHRLTEDYHIATRAGIGLCGLASPGAPLGLDGLELQDAQQELCPVCWQLAADQHLISYGV